jgi:hypothetical protein
MHRAHAPEAPARASDLSLVAGFPASIMCLVIFGFLVSFGEFPPGAGILKTKKPPDAAAVLGLKFVR